MSDLLGYELGGSTDERVLPHQLIHRVRFLTHLARYEFADENLPADVAVADVGCGTGYGTRLLAGARQVVGIDRSPDATNYAAARYGRSPQVRFVRGDAERLPLHDAAVAAVVSFELIEHVPDADQAIREMRRVLIPGSRLIISTPNAALSRWENGRPANPFHVTEYTENGFAKLLDNGGFEIDEMWAQSRGDACRRMTRYAMGVGERLSRGRDSGYFPPAWERRLHAAACPLLARTSWRSVRREVRVHRSADNAEFLVALAHAL